MPREYLGSGTGVVFVVLGRRILDGKLGVFHSTSLAPSLRLHAKGMKLLVRSTIEV